MNTLSQPIQAKTSSGGVVRILAMPAHEYDADVRVLVAYNDGSLGFEELRFLRYSALPVWQVEAALSAQLR